MELEHTEHKATICPGCGAKLDCSTHPKGAPSPGDLSLCLKCGQPLTYEDDLSLRALSTQDIAALQLTNPAAFREYEKALALLERFWQESGKGPR